MLLSAYQPLFPYFKCAKFTKGVPGIAVMGHRGVFKKVGSGGAISFVEK